MNHIYFTALVNGAGLAAALAEGVGPERVYIFEPTGSFENDPNVTDKNFPGNPTRSYRSEAPLKIVGELTEWVRQTTEDIQPSNLRTMKKKHVLTVIYPWLILVFPFLLYVFVPKGEENALYIIDLLQISGNLFYVRYVISRPQSPLPFLQKRCRFIDAAAGAHRSRIPYPVDSVLHG
jgi:hypothetical protein